MSKRVAVTISSLDGLDSKIDPRFGRAFAFLIVDAEDRKILEQVENDAVNAAHGAGTGAAATMARNNVQTVISGRFGPKAYQALGRLGIKMMVSPEGITASEALDKLASGEIKPMEIKVY